MKKIITLIFSLIAVVGCSNQNYGNGISFKSGNNLHEILSSTNEIERLTGTAYIVGVVDGRFYKCNELLGTTPNQLRDTVKKFLDENPEKRQYAAASIIDSLIKDKYGCK